MAKADSDNTITQLYRDFEKAYAGYSAIPDTEEERWGRALRRCNSIADRILVAPSKSLDEMLLKIRITGWCLDASDTLTAVDDWKPTRRRYPGVEFHAYLALATLRDDIRRLAQHGPTANGEQRSARAFTSDKRVSRGQK